MNTKTNNHRDFIDFLLLLYRHSKKFFLILISFVLFAFLIDYSQTPLYKFNVRIKVPASNDVFMPVIMYRDSLRMASDEAVTNKGKEFSTLGVDHLINDLLLGGRIFPIIDENLKNSLDLNSNVRSFIDAKRDGEYFNIDVNSNDEFLVNAIHKNIMPSIQSEITSIYEGIIQTHKNNTIKKIESLIKKDTSTKLREVSTELLKNEFSNIKDSETLSAESLSDASSVIDELREKAVYSSYNENLEYIKNLEIPNLDLPYIYFIQTAVIKDTRIPTSFIYIFSTFLSIFAFIFIVIVIDLKNQVFHRKEALSK